MVPDDRPRIQISLAAMLLSVSFFCMTIVCCQLAYLFLLASSSVTGASGHAARVVAASMIILGAMIGSLAAGRRRTAIRGAIIGALFGICAALVFILGGWMLWWTISHNGFLM